MVPTSFLSRTHGRQPGGLHSMEVFASRTSNPGKMLWVLGTLFSTPLRLRQVALLLRLFAALNGTRKTHLFPWEASRLAPCSTNRESAPPMMFTATALP